MPYNADYFGHKLHLDQNEKLVMYRCTTVFAVDGFSSMVMAAASMPVKNSVEIYCSVFRYKITFFFSYLILLENFKRIVP